MLSLSLRLLTRWTLDGGELSCHPFNITRHFHLAFNVFGRGIAGLVVLGRFRGQPCQNGEDFQVYCRLVHHRVIIDAPRVDFT